MRLSGNWSLPVMLRALVRYSAGALCVCCLLFVLGCGSDVAEDVEGSGNEPAVGDIPPADPAAVGDATAPE